MYITNLNNYSSTEHAYKNISWSENKQQIKNIKSYFVNHNTN